MPSFPFTPVDENKPKKPDELDNRNSLAVLAQASVQPTLLPPSVASAVSLATRTSSFTLSVGSFFGNLAINGARTGTLAGLELSRSLLELIVARAGQDVADRSLGPMGKAAAEGVMGKSLGTIHSTITYASFFAAAAFRLTSTAVTSTTLLSQNVLSSLDAILGDTESSRAIAAIVSFAQRDLRNPKTGLDGEAVSFTELMSGLVTFVLLQRWGQERSEREIRDGAGEEDVCDIVMCNGKGMDVVTVKQKRSAAVRERGSREQLHKRPRPSSFVSVDSRSEVLEAMPRGQNASSAYDEDPHDTSTQHDSADFSTRLMQQLQPGASVSITSVTTEIVTVEVRGEVPNEIMPPRDYTIVERTVQSSPEQAKVHKLVFHSRAKNIRHKRWSSMDIDLEQQRDTGLHAQAHGEAESVMAMRHNTYAPSITDTRTGRDTELFSARSVDASSKAVAAPHPPHQLRSNHHLAQAKDVVGHDMPPDEPRTRANQKRSRTPSNLRKSLEQPSVESSQLHSSPGLKYRKSFVPDTVNDIERKLSFRQSLKRGASGTSLGKLWNRDATLTSVSPTKPAKKVLGRPPNPPPLTLDRRTRETPGETNYARAPRYGYASLNQPSEEIQYSMQTRRRESRSSSSVFSAGNSRSPSPGAAHTGEVLPAHSSIENSHHRATPSDADANTLRPDPSLTALVLSHRYGRHEMDIRIPELRRTGILLGQYPAGPLVHNLTRFDRFSSASYGSSFLRFIGPQAADAVSSEPSADLHHREHLSFAKHTGLPPSMILLSSFVDPSGGTDSSGNTDTGVPLVHYVSLDHESGAVVLTCRGTLGFEDVLTDAACDYDLMEWRGRQYQCHKGIYASARRLLEGGGGRVMAVIKAALEEFPEYGLVLCGHSLGGGVAAILAILVSEPNPSPADRERRPFVTASSHAATQRLRLTDSTPPPTRAVPANVRLPSNRPIHVYTYGSPAVISPSLSRATRGLVTSVVNNHDFVPYFSIALLHDLQAIALAFKADTGDAKGEIKRRVWDGVVGGLKGAWRQGVRDGAAMQVEGGGEEDHWPWAALKSLRACMLSDKLVPPGDVFVVETTSVLQRDAFTGKGRSGPKIAGRPATRAKLIYIHDIETRFREIRFGARMFSDHSPVGYQRALEVLERGVC
ncbi:hypothetical protein BJ546DRAFT_843706 [Cryomyces antarcticus]